MSVRTSLLLAAIAFVAACGGQTGTADHAKQAASDSSKPTAAHQHKQDNVFTPLTSTIDRAKAVQGIVDKQAAKQRQAIENQSK